MHSTRKSCEVGGLLRRRQGGTGGLWGEGCFGSFPLFSVLYSAGEGFRDSIRFLCSSVGIGAYLCWKVSS